MLLLGVTAMSLLTTPIVIMGSIQFLAKDGHGHQVYITGGWWLPGQGLNLLGVAHMDLEARSCFWRASSGPRGSLPDGAAYCLQLLTCRSVCVGPCWCCGIALQAPACA